MAANRQASTFQQVFKDTFIPFGLLNDTIELDLQDQLEKSTQTSNLQSLTTFALGKENYLIHLGGEYLDELVVRNANFLLPQYCYPSQPSFSVNISKGSPIRQLVTAGKTDYGTCVNVLAGNRGEIFYLQAFEADEMLDEGLSLPSTVILEPKGKWQLPEELSVLRGSTTSISSHLSHAVGISMKGKIFIWNPMSGVLKHSDKSPISPTSSFNAPLVELSVHPSNVYIANNNSVYNYDLRSCELAPSLYFSDSNITSLAQSQSHPNHYYASNHSSIMLLDNRFPNQHIYKQFTADPYNFLRHKVISNIDSSTQEKRTIDLLLGGNQSSFSNIYLHSINDRRLYSSVPLHPLQSHSSHQGSLRNRRSHLSSILSPFSARHIPSWKTEALPVVDSVSKLIGLDILMLSDIKAPYYKRSPSGSSKKGSSTSSGSRKKSNTFQEDDSSEESDENDNSTESEEGTSSQTRFQDSNSSFPIPPGFQYDFCGYILQQSQFGDVFAQMISWGDVNYEDFASPLLKDSEAYRSDSSLTASSSYSAKPLFSFQETNAYIHEDNDEDDVGEVGMSRHQVTATFDADREDDSEDDDEEDDDEDNLVSKGFGSQVSLTRNKSNQSFPFSGLSPVKKNPNRPNRRTKGRVTVKEEKFRKVTLSPINWFASIGNRHDLSLTTLEAAKVIMTFLNYRKQQILASSSSTKKSLTDKDSAVANSVKMSSSLVKIFQYLQAYFRALDPFQSHESILSALQLTSSSLHTNDIMTGEESTLSSFHFIPFLPQDGLLPYDIFKFHLLDLRIDLAEIPKPPHLFFVKAPSSLIQNNLLIIYELIVKYLPTLISSFSIPNPSKETGGPTPGMVTFSLPSSSSATTNAKEDLSLTIYRSLYEIWDELFRLSKIRVELSALRIALKYFHDEHLQMMKNGSLKERRSTGLSLEFIPQPLLPSRFELLKKAHNSFYSDGLLVEAREDSEDEGESNDEGDTLDLAQDKKRQKTLSNQQSKEDEMEEEEASSSDESFYNVSNIVKQPSSQPQNFPSSSIPVEKPETIPSNQIASYNSQASLYYGCAECSFGHYGGSVDAIWESHRCEKRDCLLPHLTMFAINIVNIDTATWKRKKAPPRRERNSQKEQPAGMRKHTDITSDLLSILSEKWDQTIDTAFPRWNQQRPMNLYN